MTSLTCAAGKVRFLQWRGPQKNKRRRMRYLLAAAGVLSLSIGIAGIFLPLVPTTPLLLLAAALFCRSSPKLYDWLLAHPVFGTYIRNYRENKAIPLKVKIVSITLLWATLLYCTFFVTDNIWLRIMFLTIASGVTIHILSHKTLR